MGCPEPVQVQPSATRLLQGHAFGRSGKFHYSGRYCYNSEILCKEHYQRMRNGKFHHSDRFCYNSGFLCEERYHWMRSGKFHYSGRFCEILEFLCEEHVQRMMSGKIHHSDRFFDDLIFSGYSMFPPGMIKSGKFHQSGRYKRN